MMAAASLRSRYLPATLHRRSGGSDTAAQYAQLDFSHVQPASVNGCVVLAMRRLGEAS